MFEIIDALIQLLKTNYGSQFITPDGATVYSTTRSSDREFSILDGFGYRMMSEEEIKNYLASNLVYRV